MQKIPGSKQITAIPLPLKCSKIPNAGPKINNGTLISELLKNQTIINKTVSIKTMMIGAFFIFKITLN